MKSDKKFSFPFFSSTIDIDDKERDREILVKCLFVAEVEDENEGEQELTELIKCT
jgi:hypothetical protein